MTTRLFPIAALLALLLTLTLPLHALARAPQPDFGFSEGGDVGLKVSAVGLDNKFRPGDWAGIQVEVLHRSSNPRPFEVIIRIDVTNDDGDKAQYWRKVTTSPNRPVATWLYVWLPFEYDTASELTARAFIPIDQEAGADVLSAYDSSKPVGMVTHRLQQVTSYYSGLIGIVGRGNNGLERYAERIASTNDIPATGHEITTIAGGLSPAAIPDRAHGLRAFEALVWTGSTADDQPGKLAPVQAAAIREWVASGGHLVIVMPLVGQTWLDTPNPLSDILPAVHPVRRENVPLGPIRFLLTPERFSEIPATSIMYSFTPDAAAGPFDAMPVLRDPEGQIIGVRRQYGIGAVTMLGVDVNNLNAAGAIRADAFWHRVLGKRQALPTRRELDALQNSNQFFTPTRKEARFEESITARLNWESQVAIGLLIAVVVFSGFWLIAGPVGFFFLKQRSRIHHSWLAYAATIAAFTAISWSAASVLRQRSAEARHLTIIDHVYGQPCQRARAWANVFLPSYGSTTLSAEKKRFDLAGTPLEPTPAITTWSPVRPGGGGASEFPETRTFPVDARSPDSITIPSRSTTRQIQVDWTGAPQLSMPFPQSPNPDAGVSLGDELSLAVPDAQGQVNRWTVNGSLTHDLPLPLTNVIIIVNRGLRPIGPLTNGALPCDAGVFKLDTWAPKTPLDLAVVTAHGNDPRYRAESFLEIITPRNRNDSPGYQIGLGPSEQDRLRSASSEVADNLVRLSLYTMLQPPRPSTTTVGDALDAARRASTQTLDLGRWFTQPSVIVIGFMGLTPGDKNPTPVPLQVDGEPLPSNGITCVRWIYPLKPHAPAFDPPVSDHTGRRLDGETEGPDANK